MNGAILLIPLFLIRYGLLALINKMALPRAAYFPPMQKTEKVMFYIYQISTILILIYMFFLNITVTDIISKIGLGVYALGVVSFAAATVSFAKPSAGGINQYRLYRLSRNPMYVAYFIYFLGCVLITRSILLLILVCAFQIAAYWIILAEERWCSQTFGDEYTKYMNKVRRYI